MKLFSRQDVMWLFQHLLCGACNLLDKCFSGSVILCALIILIPHAALRHDSVEGILFACGRVIVFFEQPFYDAPHAGLCALFQVPIDGLVGAQRFGQFARDGD